MEVPHAIIYRRVCKDWNRWLSCKIFARKWLLKYFRKYKDCVTLNRAENTLRYWGYERERYQKLPRHIVYHGYCHEYGAYMGMDVGILYRMKRGRCELIALEFSTDNMLIFIYDGKINIMTDPGIQTLIKLDKIKKYLADFPFPIDLDGLTVCKEILLDPCEDSKCTKSYYWVSKEKGNRFNKMYSRYRSKEGRIYRNENKRPYYFTLNVARNRYKTLCRYAQYDVDTLMSILF